MIVPELFTLDWFSWCFLLPPSYHNKSPSNHQFTENISGTFSFCIQGSHQHVLLREPGFFGAFLRFESANLWVISPDYIWDISWGESSPTDPITIDPNDSLEHLRPVANESGKFTWKILHKIPGILTGGFLNHPRYTNPWVFLFFLHTFSSWWQLKGFLVSPRKLGK